MNFLNLVGFGIGTTLVAGVVKLQYPQYAVYIKGIAGMLILISFVPAITPVVQTITLLASNATMDSVYLEIIFKIIGISYAAEISSMICRDAGDETMAKYIEYGAKIAILLIGNEIIMAVIHLVIQIMNIH